MDKCPNCGFDIKGFVEDRKKKRQEAKERRKQNFENSYREELASIRRRYNIVRWPMDILKTIIIIFGIIVLLAFMSLFGGHGFFVVFLKLFEGLRDVYSDISHNIILVLLTIVTPLSFFLMVRFSVIGAHPSTSRKEYQLWEEYKKAHPLPE